MKVLVTGASGFLGRAVVRSAAAAGHHVIAQVRPTARLDEVDWDPDAITVVRGDLRQPGRWLDETVGAQVVVHLAAATAGDHNEQWAGTVVATEQLLANIDLPRLDRFVHVSSMSVYDFARVPAGGVLDEDAPLDSPDDGRDPYTLTKLVQERLVREACAHADTPLVVVRPGAVYGPGKPWAHGAALEVGPVAVVLAPNSPMRLTHVDNCADAIVAAIDRPGAVGQTLNIVDDDPPTHLEFFGMCRAAGATHRRTVPVPWVLVDLLGRILALVDRVVAGGGARLPEVVDHPRQVARWKPLRYPNTRAKVALGWAPAVTIETGVRSLVSPGTVR